MPLSFKTGKRFIAFRIFTARSRRPQRHQKAYVVIVGAGLPELSHKLRHRRDIRHALGRPGAFILRGSFGGGGVRGEAEHLREFAELL